MAREGEWVGEWEGDWERGWEGGREREGRERDREREREVSSVDEWCVCLSTVEGLCLGILIHLSSSVIDRSHPPSYPWSSLAVDHAH